MPHGNMTQGIIAPSILAADFAQLAQSVAQVSAAPWLHIDVMDGHFVPNITIGPPVVAALRDHTRQYLDVHLMIEEPERYIDAFVSAGADGITVHAEACRHLHRVLQQIHAAGLKAGVALNPATGLDCIEWILDEVDLLLVMSVNPGFGGQRFISGMLEKVAALSHLLHSRHNNCVIEVDGGVDKYTAPQLVKAGANIFVAGTSIFGQQDPSHALNELQMIINGK